MAKSKEKLEARKLRHAGLSVKNIAKQLKVAKSTVSLWVRDIVLSVEQLEKLRNNRIIGSEKGRLLGALKQKNDRLRRIEKGITMGKTSFPYLLNRELLIAGLSLYWGEGTKKKREIVLCNSDPKLIQFMIVWFRKCFNIPIHRFRCSVGINEIHKKRETLVKDYWSDITGIPLSQFRKTSFKKTKSKKIYDNYDNYFGTLALKISKSGQLYYNILGLIEGLYQAHMPA